VSISSAVSSPPAPVAGRVFSHRLRYSARTFAACRIQEKINTQQLSTSYYAGSSFKIVKKIKAVIENY
jgi:hypothetical protein